MALLAEKSRDAPRLTEALVIVCPNPKCRKEIEEPILLTVRSVTPTKQYEACPYCFTKLEPEQQVEQEQQIVPESAVEKEVLEEDEESMSNQFENSVLEKVKGSGPKFLERVKALIPKSNGSEKEKQEKIEEKKAKPSMKEKNEIKEGPETEYFFTEEETEEAPKIKPSAEKENHSLGCPQTFGFLAKRPKDTAIPQQCMLCPKIVDCMLKLD
jgi:hypothetical protein